MKKLPSVKAKVFIKLIEKIGFEFKRQHGSHMFFKHKDGRTTVVPNHLSENLDRALMNKIIKHDLKMSRDDFLRLL